MAIKYAKRIKYYESMNTSMNTWIDENNGLSIDNPSRKM